MNTTKQPRRVFDPQQKITAVLSIWSERRTSAQLCQEMDISPALLGQWQNLAIEGMLRALDPQAEGSAAAGKPPAVTIDREETDRIQRQAGQAPAGDPEDQGGAHLLTRDGGDETGCERTGDGPAAGRGDHEGALRAHDGPAGSRAAGSLPQDLLQVGGAGACGAALEPCGSGEWPALPAGGLGETGPGAAAGAGPPGECHLAAQDGAERMC